MIHKIRLPLKEYFSLDMHGICLLYVLNGVWVVEMAFGWKVFLHLNCKTLSKRAHSCFACNFFTSSFQITTSLDTIQCMHIFLLLNELARTQKKQVSSLVHLAFPHGFLFMTTLYSCRIYKYHVVDS